MRPPGRAHPRPLTSLAALAAAAAGVVAAAAAPARAETLTLVDPVEVRLAQGSAATDGRPALSGQQSYVRFSDLFGGGAGQLPLGATIESATLSIAQDGVTLHRVLEEWDPTTISYDGVSMAAASAALTAETAAQQQRTGGYYYEVHNQLTDGSSIHIEMAYTSAGQRETASSVATGPDGTTVIWIPDGAVVDPITDALPVVRLVVASGQSVHNVTLGSWPFQTTSSIAVGGSFNQETLGATPVTYAPALAFTRQVDVTADVQAWASGGGQYGWALLSQPGYVVAGSPATTLTVVYSVQPPATVPEPATAGALAIAALAAARAGRRGVGRRPRSGAPTCRAGDGA